MMTSAGQARICLNVSMNLDERFGGLTSSLPPFCQALTQTGRFTGELAAFCEDGEKSPALLPPDAIHRFPLGQIRWLRDAGLRRDLAALIARSSIVHIHGLWREHSFVTASLCRRLGVPYVVSAHGMLEPWALNNRKWKKRFYWTAVEGRVLRGAAGLRALTEAEVSDYRTLGLRNPVEVVPNGVELPPNTSPALFFQEFPHLSGRRLILFLGRIHPKKGVDLLCRGWARVQQRFPDATLVVAGPDEDNTLASIENLVGELGIGNRVAFTGMLRGPMKWSALAAASLFVLPSHSEGFSIAILEAIGSGVPVIISRACHFPEIAAAEAGWEIDADAGQVSAALERTLSMDPELLVAAGRNGKKLVARSFTWPRVGERTADIFEGWAKGVGGCVPCGR